MLSAAVAAVLAAPAYAPAYADPVNVPSTGARPVPAGALRLPGTTPPGTSVPGPPAPIVLGPLAQQIIAAETAAARLGEQLNGIDEQLARARSRTVEAKVASDTAEAEVLRLREKAEAAAAEAYKAATEVAPYGSIGSDLWRLGSLGSGGLTAESEAAARELGRAQEEARTRYAGYTAALAVEQELTGQRTTVATSFTARQAALVDLRRRNADQLARIEAEREAYEQAQASRYGHAGSNVHGERSHPDALKAVQFALAQLGKPYEWGAEGPDRFDCSGLAWAAYRPFTLLPRVAKDQFRATTLVAYDKLLPGDLVFFATDRADWTSIHHMGIYIGDDKMVHAPTTGDVVKISSIWRSRYFGATRVLPAVPAPAPAPSPSPTPTPSPTRSPRPSRPPTPSPTPTSPTPSPTPTSPTPSPTPSPTDSPSPSPSPTGSSGTEPSPAPEPTSPAATSTSAPPDPTASASATGEPTP
ncbi:MAG TPA: C40 family peptidase [Micromonosporaceae bacterium]|nr:C40 family peptidase [Micromonosporaceae bacterium]